MVNFLFWRRRRVEFAPLPPEPETEPPPPAGSSFDLIFGANAAGLGRGGANRTSVVIIGDGTAESLAAGLQSASLANRFCTFFCVNPAVKSLAGNDVRAALAGANHVFLQTLEGLQVDQIRALAPDATITTFPGLALRGMWPFDAMSGGRDPLIDANAEGEIRHADAALVELRGLEPDKKKRLQRYLELDFPAAAGIDRVIAAQESFLATIDETSDLQLGRFISRSYRDTQLFYNSAHPTASLLQQFCELAWLRLKVAEEIPIFTGLDQGKQWSVPVHPAIARKLGVTWASGATKYTYGTLGEVTWRQWVEAYLEKVG